MQLPDLMISRIYPEAMTTLLLFRKSDGYNCGHCDLPKKGHVCAFAPSEADKVEPSSCSPRSGNHLKRFLSFNYVVAGIGGSPLLLSH
jgi:hypothetical protein